MAVPLSADLRRRLVRAVEAGSPTREAARRFEVSASAAVELIRRVRGTGSPGPAKVGGRRKPLPSGHEDPPRELAAAKPDHRPPRRTPSLELQDRHVTRGDRLTHTSRVTGHADQRAEERSQRPPRAPIPNQAATAAPNAAHGHAPPPRSAPTTASPANAASAIFGRLPTAVPARKSRARMGVTPAAMLTSTEGTVGTSRTS